MIIVESYTDRVKGILHARTAARCDICRTTTGPWVYAANGVATESDRDAARARAPRSWARRLRGSLAIFICDDCQRREAAPAGQQEMFRRQEGGA